MSESTNGERNFSSRSISSVMSLYNFTDRLISLPLAPDSATLRSLVTARLFCYLSIRPFVAASFLSRRIPKRSRGEEVGKRGKTEGREERQREKKREGKGRKGGREEEGKKEIPVIPSGILLPPSLPSATPPPFFRSFLQFLRSKPRSKSTKFPFSDRVAVEIPLTLPGIHLCRYIDANYR